MNTKFPKPMQVRVTKPIIVTERFETASWYRKIELKPGTYPMHLNDFGSSNHLMADIPGTVVESYFPSSFGGLQFGDGNHNKEVGFSQTWREAYDPESYWDRALERHDGAVVIEEES